MAKGIAGGLPLAAVTGRAEIMDAAHAGGLGGTYGGNPVACAAALGAIETMRELDLAEAAQEIEQQMLGRLGEMAARLPDHRRRPRPRRDDRGRAGAPRHAPSPTPPRRRPSTPPATGAGVVTLTCGTYGNVLRFLPPLVMPTALLAEALDVIEEAFAEVTAA